MLQKGYALPWPAVTGMRPNLHIMAPASAAAAVTTRLFFGRRVADKTHDPIRIGSEPDFRARGKAVVTRRRVRLSTGKARYTLPTPRLPVSNLVGFRYSSAFLQ